jgi:hypothetical protein
MNLGLEVVTMLAGAVAGALGALLGVGGGVLLVPFLNLAMGLPFTTASGISLVTIIATSSASSAAKGRMHLVNLRLGMVLEIFTTTGGVFGFWWLGERKDATIELMFGWTLVAIALIVLSRIDKRNVIKDASVDVGALGGRYEEAESGGVVSYRLRRPIVAFGVSFVAGIVSNFGLGGGIVKVPVLNAWCGVPIRTAAATSSLMIGATALVLTIKNFRAGHIVPELAAATVLGVLMGTQVGMYAQHRSKAKTHKIVMVTLLLSVAGLYIFRIGK